MRPFSYGLLDRFERRSTGDFKRVHYRNIFHF
jgi:hypothetical protein